MAGGRLPADNRDPGQKASHSTKEEEVMVEPKRRIPVAVALSAMMLTALFSVLLVSRAAANPTPAAFTYSEFQLEAAEEVAVDLDGVISNYQPYIKGLNNEESGYQCPFQATFVAVGDEGPGSRGRIENLTFDRLNCMGKGQFSGCILSEKQDLTLDTMYGVAQKTSEGYRLHIENFDYAFKDFEENQPGCSWSAPGRLDHEGAMDLYVNNPETITKFTWAGLSTKGAMWNWYAKGSAELTPTAEFPGTVGITEN
jgi:hypothetical protein